MTQDAHRSPKVTNALHVVVSVQDVGDITRTRQLNESAVDISDSKIDTRQPSLMPHTIVTVCKTSIITFS